MRDSAHPLKIPSMLVKRLQDCSEFAAKDGCQVRELFHPKNDPVSLPFSLAICTVAPGAKTYVHSAISCPTCARPSPRRMYIDLGLRESQLIENIGDGDLVFTAIVSPPWCAEDDIRL